MTLKERIDSFSRLGVILRDSLNDPETSLMKLINEQHLKNPWFTPENVRLAVSSIAEELTSENLEKWTGLYPSLPDIPKPKEIAVVMAGNVPLAGFHDFLCVLITGNNLLAKRSSKDPELIVFINDLLCSINDCFRKMIRFTDGLLTGFDAVIATGSDNTSRYFEYYFGKFPYLIRKNRNSVAIIDSTESDDELRNLGKDVFSYFGLGCRNVSKIYVPEKYDFTRMISNWASFSPVMNHNKYANNYNHNKAVYLVNRELFTDAGFVLIKESSDLASPVAVLYFEHYSSLEYVMRKIREEDERIQCVTGSSKIPFGKAQRPQLWDYADGADTIEFLLKKIIRNNVK